MMPTVTAVNKPKELRKGRSVEKMLELMPYALTGDGVPEQRRLKRLAICCKCGKLRISGGRPLCGVCGCKHKGHDVIEDLIRVVERGNKKCHYPEGSRWKLEGV